VREVMAVMMPAAVGSGMLQIATFTDLYFASFIPGAAAALGCKCFLHSNLL
jgi:putative peptidoglycan lipid II flippase